MSASIYHPHYVRQKEFGASLAFSKLVFHFPLFCNINNRNNVSNNPVIFNFRITVKFHFQCLIFAAKAAYIWLVVFIKLNILACYLLYIPTQDFSKTVISQHVQTALVAISYVAFQIKAQDAFNNSVQNKPQFRIAFSQPVQYIRVCCNQTVYCIYKFQKLLIITVCLFISFTFIRI